MALSQAQGAIFAGDVYLNPYKPDGTLSGWIDTGNTIELSLTSNSEVKEQVSKRRDTYGQILESVALGRPTDLSATLQTVNRNNLRYAFLGEEATYAQTGATVTGEAAVAVLDGWVQLANEDIDPATPVVVKVASATKAEGTDYLINRRLGMIKALSTGTIADKAALSIDYKSSTFAGVVIRGNVKPQIRAALLLDGRNLVDDSIGILRVWDAVLTPGGAFNFFSDDWNTIALKGRMKTPLGFSEPYRFYQR